ncbi:carbohydrate-binding domain-containing protein [Candidatus Pristimantibacillus sp. PTI5]|uniref:carbohydrate-binding domain-containing protein n=1 Tax=Candidatus Pristimantibacillus sp. PTI5 TaxID=3400422 RepID=UPI003B02CBAC
MKKKFMRTKLAIALMSAVLLASCSSNADPLASEVPAQTVSAGEVETVADNSTATTVSKTASERVTYSEEDLDSSWEDIEHSTITLNGTSAAIEGTGAVVDGNQVTIALPGVYVVSGKLIEGQIIVDLESEGTVKLVLNGAEIHNAEGSAIYSKQAGKTIISLQEGTQNIVSDGDSYASTGEDDPTAAIFSEDDLTINGAGSLTVEGNYNDGISGKDDVMVAGGNITVHAADDGLVGRDMLAIKEATITVEADGDGLKSTNDTDASKGYIVIEGGVFDLKAGNDGIQAETELLISGGEYSIVTGGGSANGAVKAEENGPGARGVQQTAAVETSTAAESESAKGLKAAADITISGGTFTIDSADDSIHSNNSLVIAAGKMSITSGDDGIHADASIAITGGTTDISKSYEGIESMLITISGGETHVVASDDGINVGGGNDQSSVNGRAGENTFSTTGDSGLHLDGGYVTVDSTGDGLDSNGSIYMTGGTVTVNGPTGNNNGALDYDGAFEISGGLLIAAGSAGMAQAPSEQSTQPSILMQYSSTQAAGTIVSVKDSAGKEIATFAPAKEYQTFVVSSPDLKQDGKYTLYSGGTSTGTETNGLYSDGVYQGGSEIVSATPASSVTYLNESGVTTGTTNGGMGGGRRTRG